MLDKLLPPKLKKKPKLQRQGTFLDKPKEALKKRKYGRDFWELATFFLFVVIYGIYLYQTFENRSKYYISLYLENQLTGGEWHPKKYYGNTVDLGVPSCRVTPSTCVHLTMKWVVSFPISGPFGDRDARAGREGCVREEGL